MSAHTYLLALPMTFLQKPTAFTQKTFLQNCFRICWLNWAAGPGKRGDCVETYDCISHDAGFGSALDRLLFNIFRRRQGHWMQSPKHCFFFLFFHLFVKRLFSRLFCLGTLRTPFSPNTSKILRRSFTCCRENLAPTTGGPGGHN